MSTPGENQKSLQLQQARRTSRGQLLRNIYGISAGYPLLSLVFVVVLGILVTALFETIGYFLATSPPTYPLLGLVGLDVALAVLIVALFLYIYRRHRDRIRPIPVTQKKALVTLISAHGDDYTLTPSFGVYEALLYQNGRHAALNALEEVVMITTDSESSRGLAAAFAEQVEASGRVANVQHITITGKDVDDVQQQIGSVVDAVLTSYKPHEVLADYTGGTKIMSVALYEACERRFVTQVYFTDAMRKRPT